MSSDFKAIITTSGTGSRLGELTQFLNKGLIRVGKKAAISYIIDQIPVKTPIVITVGYKQEQVKEYLAFAHPERLFEFVEIDPYEGENSSLGYSLLCAASLLQCPFLFIACDTLTSIPLSCPTENWLGVAKSPDAAQYTSVSVDRFDHVRSIHAKNALVYDYVYVGLAGIHDYASFWKHLNILYIQNPSDKSLNDTAAFSQMIKNLIPFKYKTIEQWFDIGNEEGLKHARAKTSDYFDNLEKIDESIYLIDNQFVIKFFHEPSVIQKRILRADALEGIVPKIDRKGENFYRYPYIHGNLYSQTVNPENLEIFLSWCKKRLWTPKSQSEEKAKTFKQDCRSFYHDKTLQRINQFLLQTNYTDGRHIINHQEIPPISRMFSEIDWEKLYEGVPTIIHGDLHFENILEIKNEFVLLDWRQDFNGLLEYGDIYYDLAKLNHGMLVSHEIIRKNLFFIEITKDNIKCDILRPDNLVVCQKKFYDFLKKEDLDIYKVEILTSLIFLNIAALHHTPYNLFLYFYGKLRLFYALSSCYTVRNSRIDFWAGSKGLKSVEKKGAVFIQYYPPSF